MLRSREIPSKSKGGMAGKRMTLRSDTAKGNTADKRGKKSKKTLVKKSEVKAEVKKEKKARRHTSPTTTSLKRNNIKRTRKNAGEKKGLHGRKKETERKRSSTRAKIDLNQDSSAQPIRPKRPKRPKTEFEESFVFNKKRRFMLKKSQTSFDMTPNEATFCLMSSGDESGKIEYKSCEHNYNMSSKEGRSSLMAVSDDSRETFINDNNSASTSRPQIYEDVPCVVSRKDGDAQGHSRSDSTAPAVSDIQMVEEPPIAPNFLEEESQEQGGHYDNEDDEDENSQIGGREKGVDESEESVTFGDEQTNEETSRGREDGNRTPIEYGGGLLNEYEVEDEYLTDGSLQYEGDRWVACRNGQNEDPSRESGSGIFIEHEGTPDGLLQCEDSYENSQSVMHRVANSENEYRRDLDGNSTISVAPSFQWHIPVSENSNEQSPIESTDPNSAAPADNIFLIDPEQDGSNRNALIPSPSTALESGSEIDSNPGFEIRDVRSLAGTMMASGFNEGNEPQLGYQDNNQSCNEAMGETAQAEPVLADRGQMIAELAEPNLAMPQVILQQSPSQINSGILVPYPSIIVMSPMPEPQFSVPGVCYSFYATIGIRCLNANNGDYSLATRLYYLSNIHIKSSYSSALWTRQCEVFRGEVPGVEPLTATAVLEHLKHDVIQSEGTSSTGMLKFGEGNITEVEAYQRVVTTELEKNENNGRKHLSLNKDFQRQIILPKINLMKEIVQR